MKLKFLLIFSLIFYAMPQASGQTSIPNATPVTQNFNSMNATTTLPGNWRVAASTATPTWGGATAALGQQASAGTPATGATYNWGTTAATDRAAGAMSSGGFASPTSVIGYFRNTNALVLTQLDVTYNLERYRVNTAAASVQFYYSIDGTNWTAVAAGNVAAASIPTGANAYTFGAPLSVPVSFSITGLSVANNADIYLRWNLDTTGSNSQGIGVDDVSLTASFSASCSTPLTQASALATANITTTGLDLSWTNGAGTTGSMVVIRPTSSTNTLPSATNYTANTAWASAGQIDTNNRVVYRGTGTSVTGITGLTIGTQYTATIYAYNDPGSCYNTAAPVTVDFYVLSLEPTAQPAAGSFSCLTTSTTQINLSFPAANTVGANARAYLILYRIGAAPTGVPTDGAYHSPGTVFGDATVLGSTSLSGTDTSFAATGLNAGTVYYFSLVPYNSYLSVPQTINYRTAATIRVTSCTTVTAPEINIKGVIGANPSIPDGDTTPQGTDNTQFALTTIGNFQTKTFRIENVGNATLTVTGLTLTGANPGDFSFAGLTFPLNLAASTSQDFTITFTPTAAGLRTATVEIASNDSDEATYDFAIEGTGDANEIDVYGNGISIASGSAVASTANNTQFGSVNVTTGSVTRIFTIFNTGSASLTVSGVTLTGADASNFSITTMPSSPLASNTSTTLVITFDPTIIGIKNATVNITNNDLNENPYTFAIQGTGVDYITCALGLVETIAGQDFEVSPATPVMAYSYTQESGAGTVTVGGGTGYGASRASMSNKFIGARSFQIAGHSGSSTTEKTTTLDFATTDVSAYQEISLNFRLGAYSSNTTQGLDTAPEEVMVYISTNGGTTWSQEMDITGSSNSVWDINSASGSATANFDGNNITTTFSPTATSTNTGPRNITLNNLPASTQLKVRIVFSLDRTDEIWVVDDVKLQGRKLAETIWNGSLWSAGAPTSSMRAIINGAYNTGANGNIQACECQINTGFTMNIPSGSYIEIQSNITNSGTLNRASGGNLIQRNNNAANTGTATISRTTSPYEKFDYTYWASPISNGTVGGAFSAWRMDYAFLFNTSNFADLDNDSFDDDHNAWQHVTSGSPLVPGKGYAIMAPTTGTFPTTTSVSFSGAINNGVINAPMFLSANPGDANDDYNLIGNPYPSVLDADLFIPANTSVTTGTLYFWTHVGDISASNPGPDAYNFITDDYAMRTMMGGTASATGSPAPTRYIASEQGFFVEAVIASDVVFNNSMRATSFTSNFYRNAQAGSGSEDEKDRIWLNMKSPEGLFSQQLIGYTPAATLGVDRGYDGMALKSENSVSFYSLIDGSDEYRIQARPDFDSNDRVDLGYKAVFPGQLNISIGDKEGQLNAPELNIYLHDKMLGIFHDLKQGPYFFTTTAGVFNDRFVLRYTTETLGTGEIDIENAVVVATGNSQLVVKSFAGAIGKVLVYDILGRQLFAKQSVGENELLISGISPKRQTLIVKTVLAEGQTVTRKVLF